MNGRSIVVPDDRTMNQPVTGFCRNPGCRDPHPRIPGATVEHRFTVEHDHFSCDKCGANRSPMIGTLTLTHLLVPDITGPVKGTGGRCFKIACDSKRAYLATVTNDEAATDNIEIANCPGCIAAAEALRIPGTEKNLLSGQEKQRRFTMVPTVDGEPTNPPSHPVSEDDDS